MRRERKPKEPDVSIEVAKWGDEAVDIEETRKALADVPRDRATGHRLASVAGCSAQDLILFRCEPNAIVSLTPATRKRLRDWASAKTTELPRIPYEIPATTLPAEEEKAR